LINPAKELDFCSRLIAGDGIALLARPENRGRPRRVRGSAADGGAIFTEPKDIRYAVLQSGRFAK
jgi:hypothetical protein